MRILIDFDEVIYNLFDEGIEIYNERYGKNFTKEDMKHYFLNDDILKCIGEVKYEKGDKGNAIYYIRELSKNHDVYIITASMKENLIFKIDWIERNLKDIGYAKTIVAQNKHMVHADIIIDDYQNNIIGHPAKYRFLVDAPYNRHVEESDKIIRVKGLGDVLKYLEVL